MVSAVRDGQVRRTRARMKVETPETRLDLAIPEEAGRIACAVTSPKRVLSVLGSRAEVPGRDTIVSLT